MDNQGSTGKVMSYKLLKLIYFVHADFFFTLGLSSLTFHAQAQPLFKEISERGPNKLGIFLYRSFQLLVRWGHSANLLFVQLRGMGCQF